MDVYDQMAREELISLVRRLRSAETPESPPVFDESERRSFEASLRPMRIFDRATLRFLAVNDAALALYGYTREEFLALKLTDIRHPDEHAELRRLVVQRTRNIAHWASRRHVTKSGEILTVESITQDITYEGRAARLSVNIDVTERDRALALLGRREQELHALMAHTPDVVSRLDRDFRHVYVSPAVAAVTGRPSEDFIGKTIDEVGMPPELVARWRSALEAVFSSGREQVLETEFHGPAGARRYESRIVPERGTNGEVETVITITRDFTERRRAEELLWMREQEFESLAENLPDLVARYDRGRRFLYVNSAMERLLRFERAQAVGLTQRELGLPEELAALYDDSLARVFETGLSHKIEFRLTLPEGERFFEACHVPEGGSRHPVETVLCVARDITERKRTEALQSRLAAIVNNSSDAIVSKDVDGIIQTWNPGAERLFGYCAEETVGQPATMLMPTDRHDEEELILNRIRRGEAVEHFESIRRRKDGTLLDVSLTISPIKNASGQVIGASKIARDITERKRAELAIQRSAALANLLESLARAANEAVTPEAAMAACLELICSHGGWALGRVALYGAGGSPGIAIKSIWHSADGVCFSDFMRLSELRVPNLRGSFISRVLREQTPVWVEDLAKVPSFGRKAAAVRNGLQSAFAFPIVVHGAVVAIMELFCKEARFADPVTMGAAQSIASQLARLVEREWAHQANARMAAIVESSNDAIICSALDGTILTWNPGAERLLGYAADEIVGRKFEVLYPPELMPTICGRRKLVMQGKAVSAFETVRITKDGRRVQVSLSSAPIRNANGDAWAVSTIIRDITESRRAEEALRTTQQRLEIAVRGGSVGLWDWDVGAGTVYFSPEWKQQLGYEDHELPSRFEEWDSRLHPEDRARMLNHVKEFMERSWPDYQAEYRLRHRDGSYRWILSRAAARLGETGNVERMYGCHVDITVHKRQETERLERAVRQRDALVREVHHRIKNSLQGVIGLLRQKVHRYPAILPGIEEAIAQLQSVAVVYGIQGMRPDGLLSLSEMLEAICFSAESLIGGRVDIKVKRELPLPACVAGSEAVSVAVALNELVFNSLKHQQAEPGKKRARILLNEMNGVTEISILNRGRLPADFDFDAGRSTGDGLGLVRTLLTAPGGNIRFNGGPENVEVVLRLGPPLLADYQQQWRSRRQENGATTKESSAAAPLGGRRRPARAGRAD